MNALWTSRASPVSVTPRRFEVLPLSGPLEVLLWISQHKVVNGARVANKGGLGCATATSILGNILHRGAYGEFWTSIQN